MSKPSCYRCLRNGVWMAYWGSMSWNTFGRHLRFPRPPSRCAECPPRPRQSSILRMMVWSYTLSHARNVCAVKNSQPVQVEMVTSLTLIYNVLLPSLSTFETPPLWRPCGGGRNRPRDGRDHMPALCGGARWWPDHPSEAGGRLDVQRHGTGCRAGTAGRHDRHAGGPAADGQPDGRCYPQGRSNTAGASGDHG